MDPGPDPQEIGEAVLGLPVRPQVFRQLEECPFCQRETLIRFLADPDQGPHWGHTRTAGDGMVDPAGFP